VKNSSIKKMYSWEVKMPSLSMGDGRVSQGHYGFLIHAMERQNATLLYAHLMRHDDDDSGVDHHRKTKSSNNSNLSQIG
jgi:hypothetical protein